MQSSNAVQPFGLGIRQGHYCDVTQCAGECGELLEPAESVTLAALQFYDLYYRALCAVMYNFTGSGHPGGSLSSGRFVAALFLETMAYDFTRPARDDADMIVYAAGHKALGLYAMLASIDQFVRYHDPSLLSDDQKRRLGLYDLLGFRRNPAQGTQRDSTFKVKFLDGHPTPATPFVKIATGASGVGVPTAIGLALAAKDTYGATAPYVHIVEGEGGLTAGRVSEGLAMAATMQLSNVILHLDWNNASIDSNAVCRNGDQSGDYVQWTPPELFRLHDWNVVFVPDGHDFRKILLAQRLVSKGFGNHQPTAIVYRTEKGFGYGYGTEPRVSHGAGHPFCSAGYYTALQEFENRFQVRIPRPEHETLSADERYDLYFKTLEVFYDATLRCSQLKEFVCGRVRRSRDMLGQRPRHRPQLARDRQLARMYCSGILTTDTPPELQLESGKPTTLRAALGKAISCLNKWTGGAFLIGAADLLNSTSVDLANCGFDPGFFNAATNLGSRLIPAGGICEDALGGLMSGVSSYGQHIGVTSSYAAFIAALEHVPMRLHCIGQQARKRVTGEPFQTFIVVCGHAGYKTGEDGPTHADPQALQLVQGNFPPGMVITMTPWTPDEVWPLLAAGLAKRPAVLMPFVTRPAEIAVNRQDYKLPPASCAANGVYQFRTADPSQAGYQGTIILQGSAVMHEFIRVALPKLTAFEYLFNCYYVASAELFDLLPPDEQERILPSTRRLEAMGITDFTAPTMDRWILSPYGRKHTRSAFTTGSYPSSGTAQYVLKEMGLDGPALFEAVKRYAEDRFHR